MPSPYRTDIHPTTLHIIQLALEPPLKDIQGNFVGSYRGGSIEGKGKAFPLQAWSGPEGSRKLRFPDYMTTAQDGGKAVSLTHRPPLPPVNAPGTQFCQRLSRPQSHRAIERIMSMKISNDIIWNRTRYLPICSAVP
jgi:hypothetical protein